MENLFVLEQKIKLKLDDSMVQLNANVRKALKKN
jgi:hypothetical protein